jgi:hypothetical protein
MPQSIVVLHVEESARAGEILAGLAEHLHLEYIRPDDHGRAELWRQLSGPDAYEEIVIALDATADDWHDHISIRRPER